MKNDNYCIYGIPKEKRNCQECSASHYFMDCHNNPINEPDENDEEGNGDNNG